LLITTRPPAHRAPALLAALSLLAGVGLTACSSSSGSATGGAGAASSALTFAADSEPACVDPAVSPRDVTALIDRNIFDSLVNDAPGGTIKPWLAKSWTVSGDGKTYVFHLRTGVRFHDGTALDATAVKATLDHAVDPKTKSTYAAGLLSAYKSSTAVDASTVKVSLSRPDAALLQSLSTAFLGIQSAKALRRSAAQLCGAPIGSGPFEFVSWTKKQSMVLKQNPAYDWGPPSAQHTGPAHLKTLTIRFIEENTVRVGALNSGEVDVVGGLPAPNIKSLQKSSRIQVLSAQAPGGVYSLHFNPAPGGPLADKRVRTALLRSVDLTQLVKSVDFGAYDRAWSELGPRTPGYDASMQGSWPYDPALAGQLLDQAGWTQRDSAGYRVRNGKELTLRWPYVAAILREQRDVLGQGIVAQAKKVGIRINRVAVDVGTYSQDVFAGKAEIWDASNVRADPDILRTLFASDQTLDKGGLNVFRVKDPQIDAWLRAGATATDPAARAAEYVKVQRRLRDLALDMPVYVPTYYVGAAKKVHGLAFEAAAYPLFYDVWVGGA
jgi:peptide/nickel transport system substrate-binding protein